MSPSATGIREFLLAKAPTFQFRGDYDGDRKPIQLISDRQPARFIFCQKQQQHSKIPNAVLERQSDIPVQEITTVTAEPRLPIFRPSNGAELTDPATNCGAIQFGRKR